MAIPFFIPEESEVIENSPTQPIAIPSQSSQQSPQISPIDNDMIVQAFYEALCRCSQNFSPPQSSSSPFSRGGHFYFPSPSTSSFSSPRGSFRGPTSRRRLNSYGSNSQHSEESFDEYDEDLVAWQFHYHQRESLEEFSGQVPQPKVKSKTKKPKQNKITNFVISALQFVIDSLK